MYDRGVMYFGHTSKAVASKDDSRDGSRDTSRDACSLHAHRAPGASASLVVVPEQYAVIQNLCAPLRMWIG